MGSNVQSHQFKMSKVAFLKADEHKKNFNYLFGRRGPLRLLFVLKKTWISTEKMAPISHLYHILIMQNYISD